MDYLASPTLSKMTRGPLTPPIVLYRILGRILVIRGSWFSEAIVVVQLIVGLLIRL